MRVLYDVNVVLDVVADREPFVRLSALALDLAARREVEGFLAATSVTVLDYLLRRQMGAERTAAALSDLLAFLTAAPIDHQDLLRALSLGWTDFEDAVQMVGALRVGADCLVTRDSGGFAGAQLPVVDPAGLVALVGGAP